MATFLDALSALALIALAVLSIIIFAISRFDRSGDNKVFYTLLLGIVGTLAAAFLV
jgi:hypothetical protein